LPTEADITVERRVSLTATTGQFQEPIDPFITADTIATTPAAFITGQRFIKGTPFTSWCADLIRPKEFNRSKPREQRSK
jgi:hypothetical protein